MDRILCFIVVLLSLGVHCQSTKVLVLDSTLNNRWVSLTNDWRFQKGDNIEWAQPGFNDESWVQMSSFNLFMPDSKSIAENMEIVWFRKRIKADSTLNDALVMKIVQTGASEIYLDGKMIHKLGVVSDKPADVKYFMPSKKLLSLPLQPKEQVLAIRFVNDQHKFPLYKVFKGYLSINVTTLANAYSKDKFKNEDIVNKQILFNRYNIVLGVSVFLFIFFSSFFFFFPSEKVNGYFAVSSLFLILFIMLVLEVRVATGKLFWIEFFLSLSSTMSLFLLLFCVYKLLKRKLGYMFWLIFSGCILTIPLLFLYRSEYLTVAIGVIVAIEIVRINLISIYTHKTLAIIFLILSGVNLLFWLGFLANLYPLLNQFQPFAFMIIPIGLAIYLGYDFGIRSHSLRLKLAEVEQLSQEKQQILYSQNETLENQVSERTAALNLSLENLKSTQAQLIQSEKMASLGELTAGIAHEIQNPLNFVNNFSEVSNELIVEMNEELDKGDIEEAKAISLDLKQNLEKITHHGQRASSIVKGMLEHSRKSTGEKEATDINALCDEYLRLAYHGLRAKDKSFNATMETHFDENLSKIDIIPQDIGRVVLNLINNAFYAVSERKKAGEAGYEPTVIVSTKRENGNVIIGVKDNGTGIPQKLLDKIFQPFFTTKPTGQGTGLGLSLSYDIVRTHGGELKVETREGEGSEFVIVLPA